MTIKKTTPDGIAPGTRRRFEARAEVLKAMAHPARLLMLDVLSRQELCVRDLTDLLELDQSTVSKHLALLRTVGLVALRKEGSTSYYRSTCCCLEGFMDCIEKVLEQNLADRQLVMLS